MNRPNILFISDDQHRFDYVEMMTPWLRTPRLRELAEEGVWHRHAYSPCPLCMPARCTLHTGLHAHQHGQTTNNGDWDRALPTLPQALKQHGYRTAMIGKCHAHEVIPDNDLLRVTEDIHGLGYDDVHEVSGKSLAWDWDCNYTRHLADHGLLDAYRQEGQRIGREKRFAPSVLPDEDNIDHYIADRAIDWLNNYDKDDPFYMWVGLCAPHGPMDPPADLAAYYDSLDTPGPAGHPDSPEARNQRVHYAGQVELIDQQVGRILDTLEARGLTDDTLVVFVSDHGEMLHDLGLVGKCDPFDPSVRVPCMARWPGVIQPGTVSDTLLDLADLVATMLEAGTGQADPTTLLPRSPGRSLIADWTGQDDSPRGYVFSEDGGQFPRHPPFVMIRTLDHKYIMYTRDQDERLYDMNADPHETRNLIDNEEYAEVREQLRRRLIHHFGTNASPRRPQDSAAESAA